MSTIKPTHMTKFLPTFQAILLVSCLFVSCSVIRVVEIPSPTSDCAGSGQHFCHDTTIRSSVWKPKNKINLKSACPTGISRFKVTTKPMDVVLGFITLGLVVKQRIDWIAHKDQEAEKFINLSMLCIPVGVTRYSQTHPGKMSTKISATTLPGLFVDTGSC